MLGDNIIDNEQAICEKYSMLFTGEIVVRSLKRFAESDI